MAFWQKKKDEFAAMAEVIQEHPGISPAELARAGVSEDLVRLSIGIEHVDDIIADVEQELAAAG